MMPHRLPIHCQRLGTGPTAPLLELWPRASAATVLFYAGTMLSPLQYRTLLSALHQAGLAVAALHFRGHGLNPHTGCFSFDDLLQDCLLAEHWLRQQGRGPLVVCGHSQGAILALAHAGKSDALRMSFPISGTLPQLEESIELTHFRAFRSRRAELLAGIRQLARWLPWLPLPVMAYLSLWRIKAGARELRSSNRRCRYSYPLAFLASLFSARVSPQLRCPVTLFSAVDDALFTPPLITSTFSQLQAPAKKLIWLPGGGHLAVFDPGLCQFLARQMAAICAGMGLPLHTGPCPDSPTT